MFGGTRDATAERDAQRPRLTTRRIAALAFAVLAAACSEPQSRGSLDVSVDADAKVRNESVEVSVRVEKQDASGAGWKTLAEQRFAPADASDWPLTLHPIVSVLSGRYQLTATARDQRDAVIAQARLIKDLSSAQARTLRVRFDDDCFRRTELCRPSETCIGGACVSATAGDTAVGTAADPQSTEAPRDSGSPNAAAEEPKRSEAAPQCTGQVADYVFCDGDIMRDCSDPLQPPAHPCGDHEHCVPAGSSVRCGCVVGFVEGPAGCKPATDCAVSTEACDALTHCQMAAGEVTCSPCPQGYGGDGRTGCLPLLAALTLGSGALEPKFSPEAQTYRAKLPLLATQLELQLKAPEGTTVRVDDQLVEKDQVWRSRSLPRGASNDVEVELTSASGVHNSYAISVQRTGAEEAYIKASNPNRGDFFGFAVVVDGDTLVVGAPSEDSASADRDSESATDSGAVYVFGRDASGEWTQRGFLKASTPIPNERFGVSIALSGDLMVIGACANDPIDRPTTGTTPGAAYVFARSAGTWSQAKRLVAPDAAGLDMFGFQVHLTADSVFVSAPYESSQQTRSGAAYVFDRADASWSTVTKLKAAKPVAESALGTAIAVDGDTLVIGAFSDPSEVEKGGSAYVFERANGTWSETQRLAPRTPARGATFGWSAAVAGDTIVVGAPRWSRLLMTPNGEAYVFRRGAEHWEQYEVLQSPMPRQSDYFGSTLHLTSSTLVVAASGDWSSKGGIDADPSDGSAIYSGAIFLYAREAQSSVRNTYIKATQPASEDGFGFSMSVSGDVLATGAPYENGSGKGTDATPNATGPQDTGAAYVFR